MKRISCIIVTLVLCLTSCNSQRTTKSMLTGMWQQADHEALWDRQPVYELYFTDDGFLYLLCSGDATDVGWHTEVFSYRYSVEDNKFNWSEADADGYYYENVQIKLKKDSILLTISEEHFQVEVELIKTSETLPFGYTQADKYKIAAEQAAICNQIIDFSIELSRKTNLPLTFVGNAVWLDQSVLFTSDDVYVCITLRKSTYQDFDGQYINVPPTGLSRRFKCFILGEYALLFDTDDDTIPDEWLLALEAVKSEYQI